jgi:hypothetical protein
MTAMRAAKPAQLRIADRNAQTLAGWFAANARQPRDAVDGGGYAERRLDGMP